MRKIAFKENESLKRFDEGIVETIRLLMVGNRC
jgi:hypothetical protein